MSKNTKIETNFERFDEDKKGNKIPIYRTTVRYRTKKEVQELRDKKGK